MWRNNRDRRDDPRTLERETPRLARDEYERPRYGTAPGDRGAPRSGGPWARGGEREPTLRGGEGRTGAAPREMSDARHPGPRPRSDSELGRPPSLESVRAHELMTRRVASVHPATSVGRAARVMEDCDCGALPVLNDSGVLIGIVTDRDIAIRLVARGRDARDAIVADCMTERVVACYANESLLECMRQMAQHQVRRMPIVDERGRLVGIIAQGDLARHAGREPLADEPRALAETVCAVSEPTRRSWR